MKILIKFIRGDQRLEKVVKIRHSRPRSQVERGAGAVQKHTPALGAGCLRSSCGRPAWTWREGTAAWNRSCWRGDGGRRAPSLAAAAPAPRSLPSQPAAGSWLRPALQRTSGPEHYRPWKKDIDGQESMNINDLLLIKVTCTHFVFNTVKLLSLEHFIQ